MSMQDKNMNVYLHRYEVYIHVHMSYIDMYKFASIYTPYIKYRLHHAQDTQI